MTPLQTVAAELRGLPTLANVRVATENPFIRGAAVVFDYPVSNGRYKDRTFAVAVGFQEDAYPEYPPHFIYVADLDNPGIRVHSSFDHAGHKWSAFSVPPSDFWDSLAQTDKNMRTYVNRHLPRFWSQV